KKFQKQKEVKAAISAWNASHAEPDEQIKKQKYLLEIPEKTVSISADEIGVKHQKEHRTPENEKQGAFVWNTVVTIETSEFTHTLTNTRMRRTFCNQFLQSRKWLFQKLCLSSDFNHILTKFS
ncbi:MAG: hypothetical protein V3G42_06370, partial [Oscillospiraceae bacterium]